MHKRALISVSEKQGIVEIAKRLTHLGFELISTGGTKKALEDAGVPVAGVETVTNFPECFGGRVKTMHPLIMGGVLFKRTDANHVKQAAELGIKPIDLVIINLYPFEETVKSGKSQPECVEQIDIGGPTLLRSAAKNFESVTVICDSADYDRALDQIEKNGDTTLEFREELATKVFLHTAAYDALITEYLSDGMNRGVMLTNGAKLRYGENPHQWGKYFELASVGTSKGPPNPATWGHLYQGKEVSYLNILDADMAWNAAQEFTEPTAVFVKHANPSGIASHENIAEAFQRAYDADRLSAFGVIIAMNRTCTAEIARKIIDQKIFTEVLLAPEFEPEALEIIKQKPNIRVVRQHNGGALREQVTYRSVMDGMIVQDRDNRVIEEKDLTCVTKKKPTSEELRDLLFAWKTVKHAKSNAIVFAKDLITIGIGSGQTSRVDATWIASRRAGEKAKGAVMASDAFFPFPDSVEEAAKHGIAAIIQPGGSVKDAEVFAKADELGLAMVTTGVRAFRH